MNGNFLTGTLDDCANYCDKESKCKGFWFMSNTCQLKTEMCDSLEKRGLGDMYYVKGTKKTS